MKTMTVTLEIETEATAAVVRRGFNEVCEVYDALHHEWHVVRTKQVSVQVADQTKPAKKRKAKR